MLDRDGNPPGGTRSRTYDEPGNGLMMRFLGFMGFRRRQRAASELPLSTIHDAPDAACRVRGRVHVLRAVRTPTGGDTAAFLARRTTRVLSESPMRTKYGRPVMTEVSHTEETTSCGRFAVIDGTGVAVVDDDCIEIVPRSGSLPPGGVLSIVEGTVVEVAGPAARGSAPDVTDLLPGTHRTRPVALVFDGRPGQPVRILVGAETQ